MVISQFLYRAVAYFLRRGARAKFCKKVKVWYIEPIFFFEKLKVRYIELIFFFEKLKDRYIEFILHFSSTFERNFEIPCFSCNEKSDDKYKSNSRVSNILGSYVKSRLFWACSPDKSTYLLCERAQRASEILKYHVFHVMKKVIHLFL